MSRKPAARVPLQTPPQQQANRAGTLPGNGVRSDGAERIAARASLGVSVMNARRAVSISNSTQPNAQMSARRSTGRPRACSGAM